MEVKKINEKFSFVNVYKSSRNGFSHTSTLMQNGREVGSGRCGYLNRTWEEYSYQSSMQQCVRNVIDFEKQELLDAYKSETGRTRLTTEKKAEIWEGNERLKELDTLYESL